ncbi:PepSY-associated TM helix domain-containing protein [Roseiconus lacunae]|uniref:PepSY-associated TM helix domain-containing protein n=1 Tax=Roseiconus lacunae TaxID=2605694 RepID=UPI0011F2ED68|nr:PepSY domain-containing protein [Roseiconus lacunae]
MVKNRHLDARLKRWFWAWHFWIGLVASPVLVVLAVTGAIYIFKSELEIWWYADQVAAETELMTPSGTSIAVQPVVDQVMESLGDQYSAYGMEIETGSGRAPAVLAMSDDGKHDLVRRHFDPADGRLMGEIPSNHFFDFVLDLHRRLMLGTIGRVLVELTTGWTIVVVLMGIVIWWPRSWKQASGVFWPRLRAKRYVQLRDLHSVGGVWAGILIVLISLTGLLFSIVWGSSFHATAFVTGQYDAALSPPQSVSSPDRDHLDADRILKIARKLEIPTGRMSVDFARTETDSIKITAGHKYGAQSTRLVILDRASGDVLSDHSLSSLPPMAVYTQIAYPLHIGTIGGLPTKILWLIASLILVALPFLGIAMWWTRRKPGASGAPNRPAINRPWWVTGAVIVLGISLPVVGISMIAITIIDSLIQRFRQRPIIPDSKG